MTCNKMVDLKNILGMVCTEAFEHAGIPEVPDHKHGAPQNYSALKREAREVLHPVVRPDSLQPTILRFDLELVQEPDGTLNWVE